MKTTALPLTCLPQHPNVYSKSPSIQLTLDWAGAQFTEYFTDCTYADVSSNK